MKVFRYWALMLFLFDDNYQTLLVCAMVVSKKFPDDVPLSHRDEAIICNLLQNY